MAALPLAVAANVAQQSANTQQPTDTSDQPDLRRITEHDPDVARLKTRTVRRLTLSIRRFVRDLKSGMQPGEAQSAFIHRHTALMRAAYLAAHQAGQRDYYGAVSRVPGKWAKLEPDNATIGRRMAFYAPSVAKMAYEAVAAFNQLSAAPASSDLALSTTQGQSQQSQTFAEKPTKQDDPLAYWQEGTAARIVLQADLTWSGVQDGYMEAGWGDSANPFSALWWDLEPIAQHCQDCPMFAAGSPYDPPWTNGGNILNATPGDGNTECGAACKCSLRYGAGAAVGQQPMDMRLWLPTGIPPDVAGVPEDDGPMAPTPPPPASGGRGSATGSPAIPGGAFNAGQKRALDLYRLAELEWNAVRGELPELPNFFTLTNPDFEWPRLSWEDLTRAQQRALETAFEAYAVWMANVPSEWLDYLEGELRESDVRDVVKLFNPNHDARGRFAVGSGISQHDVSGGGSHGAAQHAGSGHVGAHVGAHAVTGGGGGGTAAKKSAAKPAAKTPAKKAPAKKPAAPKKKAEPTKEELEKAAQRRITKARTSLNKSERALKAAEKEAEQKRAANKDAIERLENEHHNAYVAHFNSHGAAKEAIAESRAAAKVASGKAPKTAARMEAARQPYHDAKAAYEAAKKVSDASKAHENALFEKYDYSAYHTKYGYSSYDRFIKDHPDYNAAVKQSVKDERATDKAQSLLYRKRNAYERPRDQLAGKITDADIAAHPLRAKLQADLDAAKARLDEATGQGKVREAFQAREAAKNELADAISMQAHPTWKYPVHVAPTASAKYDSLDQWSAAHLNAAQRAEAEGKQRIQNGEMDRHVGDLALHSLQHTQGFDGKPNIVDEATLEAGIKAGDHEVWRGDTKQAHTDNYMIGDYHAGLGIRGNGTYGQSGNRDGLGTARSYATAHGNKGTIMRLAIKSDAKVVAYEYLQAQQRQAAVDAQHRLQEAQKSGDAAAKRLARAKVWLTTGDSSRFAVAMGYDAIMISAQGQVIILNRTAIRISNQIRDG